jgi:type II secretory pathway component PulK
VTDRATIPSPRGFVMPLVLLALVVVGLGVGVSMSRFAAETRVVERQLRAYHEHHAGMGLQEAIGAWLKQQTGRAIADLLDPVTGHAMDIELADGSVVSVYLRDGQGTALADLSALPSTQVDEAGVILRNLATSMRAEEYLRLTRSVGPSSISVNSATEPVLRAVAIAISGDRGEDLANEIIRTRARSGTVTRQDITTAVGAAGLTNEQRVQALRLFATDVELWAIIVELKGGRGLDRGKLLSRYGGLARLRVGATGRRGATSASNASELGSFLTWRDLGVDSDGFDLRDLDER